MIRYAVIAISCLTVALLVYVVVVSLWSPPVKVSVREFKQYHSDMDVSAPCGPACPPGWLNYQGKCYFFSEEEKNWASSQSFCASYSSSLAVIESESEKVFMLRYKCSPDHWIGLRKEPDPTWKWVDGTELKSLLEVRGDGGDCAFLDSDFAVSSHCHRLRNWICSHADNYSKQGSCSATK